MARRKKKLDKAAQKPVKGSRKQSKSKSTLDRPKPKPAARKPGAGRGKLETTVGGTVERKTRKTTSPKAKKKAETKASARQSAANKTHVVKVTERSRSRQPKTEKSRRKMTTPTADTATQPTVTSSQAEASKAQRDDGKPRISLPDLDWKTATCVVCGKPFDYHGRRKPKVCRDGACRYRFEYNIEPDKWAGHQKGLFDK